MTDSTADELIRSGEAETDTSFSGKVMNTSFSDGEVISTLRPVRPIPQSDTWFERVYSRFVKRERFIK